MKGIVLNTRDITERKQFEEQLQHQAFHDPVTNLANRALFSIFAADDPFIPPPHPTYRPRESALGSGQVIVVPHCGHWGLLYHATVLHEAASFLCPSGATLEVSAPRLALDAAS